MSEEKNTATEASATSWFKSGQAGYDEKKKLDTIAKLRKERGVKRFWLKASEEANIVYVDSEPFFIFEHNLKVDGRWGNYVTCTKDFDPCPVCAEGHKPTYTAYLTVIDLREFTIDGKVYKNRKILYPAKGSTILKMEDLIKEKGGDLRGLAYTVKRYTSNEPNCGAPTSKVGEGKKINIQKSYGDEHNKAHDYKKVLAPATKEELASYGFGNFNVIGSEDEVATSDVDLNIL